MTASSSKPTAVWLELVEKCQAQRSGTFFLTTEENRSGRIVIKNGQILGLVYGKKNNIEAIETLSTLTDIKYSFNEGLIFPLREKLTPANYEEIMQHLDFNSYRIQSEEQHEPAVMPEASYVMPDAGLHDTNPEQQQTYSRFYRGQEITEKRTVNTSSQPKVNKSGSTRMYRGRAVN